MNGLLKLRLEQSIIEDFQRSNKHLPFDNLLIDTYISQFRFVTRHTYTVLNN